MNDLKLVVLKYRFEIIEKKENLLFNYDKNCISKKLLIMNFLVQFGKVYCLAYILECLNTEPKLEDKLALKSDTAINLSKNEL